MAVIARAMGRLIGADDAPKLIDPDGHTAADLRGIDNAISALIEARPHLALPVAPEIKDGNDWLHHGFSQRIRATTAPFRR